MVPIVGLDLAKSLAGLRVLTRRLFEGGTRDSRPWRAWPISSLNGATANHSISMLLGAVGAKAANGQLPKQKRWIRIGNNITIMISDPRSRRWWSKKPLPCLYKAEVRRRVTLLLVSFMRLRDVGSIIDLTTASLSYSRTSSSLVHLPKTPRLHHSRGDLSDCIAFNSATNTP